MEVLKEYLGISFQKRVIARLESKAIPHKSKAFNENNSLPVHRAGITVVVPVCAQGCSTEQSEMKQWH